VAHADMPERREVCGACDGLAQRENSLHSRREEGPSGLGSGGEALGNAHGLREQQPGRSIPEERGWIGDPGWWITEPDVGRVADGVAARVDRLKAIGNGQVPICAAAAWNILSEVAQ
jgi:DNA (cytosine-5)-methyltransferase 1